MEKKASPREVAVERDPPDQRIVFREREAVPLRGHGPARFSTRRICELCFSFALRTVFIVVVSQHRITFSRKGAIGIDAFELIFPAAGVRASRQRSIPIVAE